MGTSDHDIFATHLTGMMGKQLEGIQKNTRRASLAKMGFNQNFPKASVYGPMERGALSMVDLTVEQGTRAVEGFLYHKYADDEVAKLMDISLRITKLESGQEEHLLLHPEIQIPYLTKSCADKSVCLVCKEKWVSPLQEVCRLPRQSEFPLTLWLRKSPFAEDGWGLTYAHKTREAHRLVVCRPCYEIPRVTPWF